MWVQKQIGGQEYADCIHMQKQPQPKENKAMFSVSMSTFLTDVQTAPVSTYLLSRNDRIQP